MAYRWRAYRVVLSLRGVATEYTRAHAMAQADWPKWSKPGHEGREMTKQTQGEQLIDLLKRKPMTYGEMMEAMRWQSCSPWKRAVESVPEGWQIVKGKRWQGGKRYLTTWACKRVL